MSRPQLMPIEFLKEGTETAIKERNIQGLFEIRDSLLAYWKSAGRETVVRIEMALTEFGVLNYETLFPLRDGRYSPMTSFLSPKLELEKYLKFKPHRRKEIMEWYHAKCPIGPQRPSDWLNNTRRVYDLKMKIYD